MPGDGDGGSSDFVSEGIYAHFADSTAPGTLGRTKSASALRTALITGGCLVAVAGVLLILIPTSLATRIVGGVVLVVAIPGPILLCAAVGRRIRRFTRERRGRCVSCGHDCRSVSGSRCPKCGEVWRVPLDHF